MNDEWDRRLDDLMGLIGEFERRTEDRLYADILRWRVRELRSLWYHRDRRTER